MTELETGRAGHDFAPCDVVDRQLDAYNARDLEAYCRLFASDAFIENVGESPPIARGLQAIRGFYQARFSASPNLNCQVKSRIKLGGFVIDHELVTGITENIVEVVAIYEVRHGVIQSVRFIRSEAESS